MPTWNEHPQFSILSLVRSCWRLKPFIAAVWTLVAAAIGIVAHRLPAVYQAEAAILVESQAIPEKYVSTTVNPDLRERINKISQQILSSTQILSIAERFGLYRSENHTQSREEIVLAVRRDINITIERSSKDRPAGFRIAVQNSTPQTAADVANHIADLFIEENRRAREGQALGTSAFLDDQLAEAKKGLEGQEAQLSEYKLKYNGELPQQEATLLAQVAQLQVQLQGAQDAINRAEQGKLMLQNSLAAARLSLQALSQTTTGSLENNVPASLAGPEDAARLMRAELDSLRTKYTDNHPDVRRLKAELVRLQQTPAPPLPAAARRALPVSPPSPGKESWIRERERVENLEAQLDVTAKQAETLQADRQRILRSIGAVQSRVGKLPIREQQLAAVLRDYEISKASYQSLLDKKLAADVAANMEKQQEPERFRLIDPARPPETPIKPNRPMLVALGCGLGLFLGVVTAMAIQWNRNQMQGEWELPQRILVLGRVPIIALTKAGRIC